MNRVITDKLFEFYYSKIKLSKKRNDGKLIYLKEYDVDNIKEKKKMAETY